MSAIGYTPGNQGSRVGTEWVAADNYLYWCGYHGNLDTLNYLDKKHPELGELTDNVRQPPHSPKALIIIGLVTPCVLSFYLLNVAPSAFSDRLPTRSHSLAERRHGLPLGRLQW